MLFSKGNPELKNEKHFGNESKTAYPVPLDLPVPSFYMDWDKITVPESIWVKVGKRLKEERLANARNAQERSQAERLGELRSDQFEY